MQQVEHLPCRCKTPEFHPQTQICQLCTKGGEHGWKQHEPDTSAPQHCCVATIRKKTRTLEFVCFCFGVIPGAVQGLLLAGLGCICDRWGSNSSQPHARQMPYLLCYWPRTVGFWWEGLCVPPCLFSSLSSLLSHCEELNRGQGFFQGKFVFCRRGTRRGREWFPITLACSHLFGRLLVAAE